MHRQLLLLVPALVPWIVSPVPAESRFLRDFAPTEGWVKPQELPYRAEVCLNGAWEFQPVALPRGYRRELSSQADAIRARGGTVLILVRHRPSSVGAIGRLLPQTLEVTAREATALVVSREDPRMACLSAEDLYFAENGGDRRIIKCGWAGSVVERGRFLLKASNTDWSLFNRIPEVAKCGAVVVYEQHRKPPGAALVEIPTGQGTTILSSIDYEPDSVQHVRLWRDLLARLGIQLNDPKIRWILPIATVTDEGAVWRYTLEEPDEEWKEPGFDDDAWRVGEAGFGTEVPGSRPRTPWTTSDIWLRRDLALPGGAGPDLKMLVHHDEDVEVYVNGTRVYSARGHSVAYQQVELTEAMRGSFRRGRNTIAAHCLQTAGGQYIDVGFLEGIVSDSVLAERQAHDLLLDGPVQD